MYNFQRLPVNPDINADLIYTTLGYNTSQYRSGNKYTVVTNM